MLACALLERLARLWRWQESFIGARGPRQRDVERLLVGFVDVDDGAIGDLQLLAMAGGRPVRQELAIAWRCIGARVDQEIAWTDCVARTEFECLRISAHHPKRWMRLLHRL